MNDIQRIGFVGVGRMGGPMAVHLHRAGFTVRAYDVAPRELDGPVAAGSLAEAADADALILMLPSDEALAATVEALLPLLTPGQIVVDMGTSRLETSQRLAGQLAERGATLLDAPVSGGESGAQNGTLSIMVGGPADAVERCRPLFAAMGTTITHIGGNGMGLMAKYVNQLVLTATGCAIAEAFALAAKTGADLTAIYQAVRNGLGGSRALDLLLPEMLSGNLGTGRMLALLHKDAGYTLSAAEALGAWTPVTELTHALLADAAAQGLDIHSASGLARLYEQRTDVRFVGEGSTPPS